MVNVFDVAKYILHKFGPMTAMKLQKLVYYSQAWSLVWDEKSLFPEHIQAWVNGPVVRALYEAHKGMFKVRATDFPALGNINNLSKSQKETIDGVLEFYGKKTAQWLVDLSHMEDPWKDARKKARLNNGVRGNAEISNSSMHEYYSGLHRK